MMKKTLILESLFNTKAVNLDEEVTVLRIQKKKPLIKQRGKINCSISNTVMAQTFHSKMCRGISKWLIF